MDDLAAIRRLKQGDISALASLVERYQLEAVRVAYLITHDKALAEDVMQDAFLRVYRHIHHFDEMRPFAPWFMRIVANAAVQAAQRQGGVLSLDVEPEYDGVQSVASHLERITDALLTLDEMMEQAEMRQQVWTALEQLSPDERAVMVLRYYFDYSERDLAATLQAPQGTISWRLHSARKRLSVLLNPLRPLAKPFHESNSVPSPKTATSTSTSTTQEG